MSAFSGPQGKGAMAAHHVPPSAPGPPPAISPPRQSADAAPESPDAVRQVSHPTEHDAQTELVRGALARTVAAISAGSGAPPVPLCGAWHPDQQGRS